jgi:hypothetical protein
MKRLDIPPMTSIVDAAIAVVTTANHIGEECCANYNGFDLVAHPLVTDEDDLIQAYYRHMGEMHGTLEFHPGDELGAEVILITVGLLRDCLLYGFGEDQFNEFRLAARRVVDKARKLPDCGGSAIKAARDLFNNDAKFGNKLSNAQKAMLFIAAVELMQEQADTE